MSVFSGLLRPQYVTRCQTLLVTRSCVSAVQHQPMSTKAAEASPADTWKNASSIYEFKATDIDGKEVSLAKYRGHVCLIVNVASICGMAPRQYKQLQALHEKYAKTKGLRILAFPTNSFMTEPWSDADIKKHVSRYGVTFDMFAKVPVNGANAHPLFKYLKNNLGGACEYVGFSFIKWNFSKFLVDKNGQPVARFGTMREPNMIEKYFAKYW